MARWHLGKKLKSLFAKPYTKLELIPWEVIDSDPALTALNGFEVVAHVPDPEAVRRTEKPTERTKIIDIQAFKWGKDTANKGRHWDSMAGGLGGAVPTTESGGQTPLVNLKATSPVVQVIQVQEKQEEEQEKEEGREEEREQEKKQDQDQEQNQTQEREQTQEQEQTPECTAPHLKDDSGVSLDFTNDTAAIHIGLGDNEASVDKVAASSDVFEPNTLGFPITPPAGSASYAGGDRAVHEEVLRCDDPKPMLQTDDDDDLDSESEPIFPPPNCADDIRAGLIEEIMEWIEDRGTLSRLLCITGPGRAALHDTLAELCAQKRVLAARFSASSPSLRSSSSNVPRHDVSRLVTATAFEVAQSDAYARPFILRAVQRDPSALSRPLEAQAKALLVDPLREALTRRLHKGEANSARSATWPYAIFIDGLDGRGDVDDDERYRRILAVVRTFVLEEHLSFKVILTGQPNPNCGLQPDATDLGGLLIELSEHDAVVDIRRYLQRRLRALGESAASVPSWPEDEDIETLTKRASGNFVYATTVVKFVSARDDDDQRNGHPPSFYSSPSDKLQAVLRWVPRAVDRRSNPFAALDCLYANILRSAQVQVDAPPGAGALGALPTVRLLKKLVFLHPQGVAYRPFVPLAGCEAFLGLRAGELSPLLSALCSVVKPPANDSEIQDPLRLAFHHPSFVDFLDDSRRSGDLYLPKRDVYEDLASSSLRWIGAATESDICHAFEGKQPHDYALEFSLSYFIAYLCRCFSHGDDVASGPEADRAILGLLSAFSSSGSWTRLARAIQSSQAPTRYWMTALVAWIDPVDGLLAQLRSRTATMKIEPEALVPIEQMSHFSACLKEFKVKTSGDARRSAYGT